MQPASAVQSIHPLQYWSTWEVSKLSLSPVSQRRHSLFRKWPTSGRDYDPAPAKSWADCCQEKQHRYRIYNRRLFSQPSPKSGPDCDPLPEKRLAECSCPKGPIQHLSKKTLVPTYLYSTKAVQGAGSEPVPTLEPDLCISTAKEMLPGQEDWFQSGTNILPMSTKDLLTS